MSAPDPRKAILQRLVREARAEKPAEVDWSGVEERLLREARKSEPGVRRSAYPLAWGALAVAAVAALWLAGGHGKVPQQPAPQATVATTEPLRQSGDALAIGTHVETTTRELSVEHAGRATWTLAPDSSAFLAENGERITVHLEHGSVLSQVVPNPKPETFVIETAHARVAVHGTVFRVTLQGERLIVDVSAGVVAVGPQGAEATFLLKAPAHGEFAADGRSGSTDAQPQENGAEQSPATLKPSPAHTPSVTAPSSAAAPASSVELPNEPSINDIEAGVAHVVEATTDCFRRYTKKSADGVKITVRTAVSLKIADSGSVLDVDFQPPLSPEAEQCAAANISQVTFAASKQGAKVTRMLELKP